MNAKGMLLPGLLGCMWFFAGCAGGRNVVLPVPEKCFVYVIEAKGATGEQQLQDIAAVFFRNGISISHLEQRFTMNNGMEYRIRFQQLTSRQLANVERELDASLFVKGVLFTGFPE